MTVNIAIIDKNKTYRESLKTLLEQVEGFRVVFITGKCNCLKRLLTNQAEVILMDNDLGEKKCDELISKASLNDRITMKSLKLAMFRDELQPGSGIMDPILKNSSKKEFETRIKKLFSE